MPKKKINNSSSPMDKAEEEMQEDVGTVKHTEKKRQAKTSGEEREKGKAATKEKKVKATKGKAEKEAAEKPKEEGAQSECDGCESAIKGKVNLEGRDALGRFAKGYKGGPGRRGPNMLLRLSREAAIQQWPHILEMASGTGKDAQFALALIYDIAKPRTKTYVEDPESVSPKLRSLLKKVADGQITLKAAALEMERDGIPLPETIKILLSKEEPEPPSDDDTFCTVSTEELERRKQAAEEARNNEEWLESRREEMAELHRQTSDSFKQGATPEGSEDDDDIDDDLLDEMEGERGEDV